MIESLLGAGDLHKILLSIPCPARTGITQLIVPIIVITVTDGGGPVAPLGDGKFTLKLIRLLVASLFLGTLWVGQVFIRLFSWKGGLTGSGRRDDGHHVSTGRVTRTQQLAQGDDDVGLLLHGGASGEHLIGDDDGLVQQIGIFNLSYLPKKGRKCVQVGHFPAWSRVLTAGVCQGL